MKVLLVEELSGRERLALLLVARELERRGHEVQLTDSWRLEQDFRSFQPALVADNVSDAPAHFLGKLAMLRAGQRNVNFIWEQLPNPLNLTRYRFDPLLQSSLVDGRISWGPAFKGVLLAENPAMDPSRVLVTGSPKYAVNTLYRQMPREITAAAAGLDPGGFDRVVLVADSFRAGRNDLEALRRSYPPLRGPVAHRSSPYAYEAAFRARVVQHRLAPALLKLAQARPRDLFILRLHPSKHPEDMAPWAPLLKLPNVVVRNEGEISVLVHQADLVLASRSGVLVDAYFMGRPAANLDSTANALAVTGVLRSVVEEFAPTIHVESLTPDTYDGLFHGVTPSRMQLDLAASWFGDVSPRTFASVADAIEEMATRPALPKRVPLPSYIGNWADPKHPLRRRLRNAIRARGFAGAPPPARSFDYPHLAEMLDKHPR